MQETTPPYESVSGRESKLDSGDSTVRMMRPVETAVPKNAYGGLEAPSPSLGRLTDRIERLRQRCTEALGREAFRDAYNFLKQHEEVCACASQLLGLLFLYRSVAYINYFLINF